MSYYCTGGTTRPLLASHSGVTNMNTYYFLNVVITLLTSHPSLKPLSTLPVGEPSLKSAFPFSTEGAAHFQHRTPDHVASPWAAGVEGRDPL